MSVNGHIPSTSSPMAPTGKGTSAPVGTSSPGLTQIKTMLSEIVSDDSLPKNFRKGAQGALDALGKETVAFDVRVSSAVGILDDLANDSNLPVHGRTSLWSVISRLESLP